MKYKKFGKIICVILNQMTCQPLLLIEVTLWCFLKQYHMKFQRKLREIILFLEEWTSIKLMLLFKIQTKILFTSELTNPKVLSFLIPQLLENIHLFLQTLEIQNMTRQSVLRFTLMNINQILFNILFQKMERELSLTIQKKI